MLRYVTGLAGMLIAVPAAAAEFRVEAVRLSSGGLAEISGSVALAGRTEVAFEAPLGQVDDILKSLVVEGEGVRILGVGLPGREPLEDSFSALPLKPGDLENSATLLAALKGVAVEIARADRTQRGLVIGVEAIETGGAGDERGTRGHRLSIAAEGGTIEHVAIDEATRVTILDPAVRGALSAALGVLARDRAVDRRRIALTLDGPPAGRATITYVVGAPVWKPAWRVVLPAGAGTARFQGWAVMENRTGLDWSGVALSLSSGTPVALRQTLYDSVTVPRPEAPLRVGQRIRPALDRGVMAEPAAAPPPAPALGGALRAAAPKARAFAGAAEAEAARAAPATVAPGAEVAASETVAAATFRLPGAVDLAVGRSLTLPFFDGDATATRVSVFQPGVADRHPIAAVRIRNDSGVTLPGGIVTVYDQAEGAVGFAGDAEFAGAAPGEERIVAFALDAKIAVASETKSTRAIRTARVENGLLTVDVGRERRTLYRIEGDPAAGRTLLIEHMAEPGWTVSTEATVLGRDGRRLRLSTELKPGEKRELAVTETIVDAERWSLAEAPDQILVDLVALGDRLDPRLREPLRRIAEIRRDSAAFQRAIERADEAIERIRTDQERVRANLAAVDRNGELGRAYLDRLRRQEADMARLEKDRDTAANGLAAARAELEKLVRQLGA